MKNWLSLVFLFIIFLLTYFLIGALRGLRERDSLLLAQSDSLHTYRTAEWLQVAERRVYATTLDQLKDINDSLIKEIVKHGTKNTESATVVVTKTSFIGKSKTIIGFDSVFSSGIRVNNSDTTRGVSPVYQTSYCDDWQRYDIYASRDSIQLSYVGINEFIVTQEWRKDGKGLKAFFKPKVLEVGVTNKNPYTETIGLQSFHVTQPKARGATVFGIGIAIGAAAVLLLK